MKTRGFTLIEILLATLVLAIGILSIVGLISSALNTTAKAEDDLQAVSFADMVFGYYHSSTNWTAIPPDSFDILDYNTNLVTLIENTRTPFTDSITSGTNSLSSRPFTYLFKANKNGPIKSLSLQIWPGYNTNTQPLNFYTEIFNWRAQ